MFCIWMYFHILPIVFLKNYYYSTTANSSCSAGRLQGHSAQINWHTGSTRKPCEQVRCVCAGQHSGKQQPEQGRKHPSAAAPSTTPLAPLPHLLSPRYHLSGINVTITQHRTTARLDTGMVPTCLRLERGEQTCQSHPRKDQEYF